jgi:hypothetical protein
MSSSDAHQEKVFVDGRRNPMSLRRQAIKRIPLVAALVLGLALPARANNEQADRPAQLTEVEKRIETGESPPLADKEEAVTAAGEALSSEGEVSTKLITNCGYITCSYYLSRKQTRYLAENGVAATIAAGLIPKVGPFLSAAVGLATWKSQHAAKKNQCLRIRVLLGSSVPAGFYSDGSKYCRK